VYLGWRGVHPQRLPSCLQGRALHRSIDAACVLEKRGTKSMHIFIKVWGQIKGRKIKLLMYIFVLYSLPIIFSKIFSLATLARLHFILHLKMQACNMCFTNPICIFFYFFGVTMSSRTGRYAVIDCKLKQNANEGCNSCANLAGLVLSFTACFILLVITP